jgi:nucleoside-diphosphate-sugar epimerase
MKNKSYLVTGGTGFIGGALVRALVEKGARVRVLDNDSRGNIGRINSIADKIEFIQGDIRDAGTVDKAVAGVDCVCHLAFVNGTKFFYTQPELVLDVGIQGMLNVLQACKKSGTPELVLASSSEVYQSAPKVPTDETVGLSIPDPLNPRYSYGAGKIISEMMALNYGKEHFKRVVIFRPHNVFGPQMGWEHVVPEFIIRLSRLRETHSGRIPFPIQGSGSETRAFVYIDDFIDGLMTVIEKGQHRNIYHIGTTEELPIRQVAESIARGLNLEIKIVPGAPAAGGTDRRCPDISKLMALGYRPKYTFEQALPEVIRWYKENLDLAPGRNS